MLLVGEEGCLADRAVWIWQVKKGTGCRVLVEILGGLKAEEGPGATVLPGELGGKLPPEKRGGGRAWEGLCSCWMGLSLKEGGDAYGVNERHQHSENFASARDGLRHH